MHDCTTANSHKISQGAQATQEAKVTKAPSQLLSSEAIQSALHHQVLLEVFDCIDSTNTYSKNTFHNAKNAAVSDIHGRSVVANEQTAGRGRRGRSFFSPKDSGLYMSITLKAANSPGVSMLATVAAAVAVVRAIDQALGVSSFASRVSGKDIAGIKWVNDIILNNKKVCGILAEGVSDCNGLSAIIVGIGINCSTENFPPELTEAGSISIFDRNALCASIIDNLLDIYDDLCGITKGTAPVPNAQAALISEYKSRSIVLGHNITVFPIIGEPGFTAIAKDISNEGNLIIKKADGSLETLSTGEITIRLS